MNFKDRIKVALPISIVFIVLDQWTKYLALTHLKGQSEISYLDGFFRLMFVTNRGAWGSMGATWPEPLRKAVLIILPVAFIIGLCVYIFKPTSKIKKIELYAFSFILAGGVGNIIDRIHEGAVIDMLWMGLAKYRYLQTNVFNIADVAIVIGFILLFIDYIKSFFNKESSEIKKES